MNYKDLIAVQTFTVRKEINEDLKGTLNNIVNLGINNVELARIKFDENNGKLIEEFKKSHHFNILSLQVKFRELRDDIDNINKFCKRTNCRNVVVSVLPLKCILGGEKELIDFCQEINRLASKYRAEGITMAYHHHHWEFIKFGEKNRLQILMEKLNSDIKFVTDTYWTKRCGVEPQQLIKDLDGRLLGVHIRDMKVVQKGMKVSPIDCELGRGTIDFESVIREAKSSGAIYCAIEQDSKDPLRSLQVSMEHLKELSIFK